MFIAPGAAGAVYAGSAWHRRRRQQAIDAAIHDVVCTELYNRTPVLLMKVHITSGTLQGDLRSKGLRVRLSIEKRELLKSEVTKATQAEIQCAQFDFNVGTQFMLQGDDVLCFEVLQYHPILPAKTLGTCLMPLAEVREELGGVSLARSTAQMVVKDLLVTVPKKLPEEVLGGLQVAVEFERSNLGYVLEHPSLSQGLQLPGLPGRSLARESLHDMTMLGAARRRAELDAELRTLSSSRPGRSSHPAPGSGSQRHQNIPIGTVVGQVEQDPQQQVLQTADGGTLTSHSWTDPSTGQIRHELVLSDALGNVVERTEWVEDA